MASNSRVFLHERNSSPHSFVTAMHAFLVSAVSRFNCVYGNRLLTVVFRSLWNAFVYLSA